MSAIPQEFLDRAAELSSGSTKPLDGSKKIYVEGSRADIQVPMRVRYILKILLPVLAQNLIHPFRYTILPDRILTRMYRLTC